MGTEAELVRLHAGRQQRRGLGAGTVGTSRERQGSPCMLGEGGCPGERWWPGWVFGHRLPSLPRRVTPALFSVEGSLAAPWLSGS